MLNFLNPKVADIFMDNLSTTGLEGRALKAVRTYRKNPTDEDAMHEAIHSLSLLGKNKRQELKQAARL